MSIKNKPHMTQTQCFDEIIETAWREHSSEVFDLAFAMVAEDEDETTGIWTHVYMLFQRKASVCPELLNNVADTKSWLLRETREACERRERFLAYMGRANRETWLAKIIRNWKFKLFS
jgi:hypothetical protein